VPTIEEAGIPGLKMPFWHGIWAPKGTPPEIVAKLNAAVTHALADSNVRARLTQMGQEIYPREQQTPQALAAHHLAEVEKWGAVIKATGVKAE
jgi:tripartite-type tricarboxylate transporter receptor subunit TctC